MANSTDIDRQRALESVVDELEATLRRMQLWEREAPAAARLASTQPFSHDTLTLHQWLQWQLIPRLRRILRGDGELPTHCAIRPYAEEWLQPRGGDSAGLLFLIGHLDALIRGEPPAATRH